MDIEIETQHLNLWYGTKQSLNDVNIKIPDEKVTAIIGPSGCGKSTLIRCFNRMNDIIENCKVEGIFLSINITFMIKKLMLLSLEKMLVWFFRNPILFQKTSMKMLLMRRESME